MARAHLSLRYAAAIAAAFLLWWGTQAVQARALAARESWPDVAERKDLSVSFGRTLGYMGYRELGASLTWIQGLVYVGGAGQDAADFRYLTQFADNIIALDPHFKPVYSWAASEVTYQERTPTQEEFELSVKYLELAMERFPDDYQYPWLAGLRYWLDFKTDDPVQRRANLERGAEYIERAMQCPNAEEDLATQAAFLRTELGQNQRAIDNLKQRILITRDPQKRQRLINHLGALTDAQVAGDWQSAAGEFLEAWHANLPHASASFYSLVGPRPSKVIDFDNLATERDLVGTELSLPADEDGSEDRGTDGPIDRRPSPTTD